MRRHDAEAGLHLCVAHARTHARAQEAPRTHARTHARTRTHTNARADKLTLTHPRTRTRTPHSGAHHGTGNAVPALHPSTKQNGDNGPRPARFVEKRGHSCDAGPLRSLRDFPKRAGVFRNDPFRSAASLTDKGRRAPAARDETRQRIRRRPVEASAGGDFRPLRCLVDGDFCHRWPVPGRRSPAARDGARQPGNPPLHHRLDSPASCMMKDT